MITLKNILLTILLLSISVPVLAVQPDGLYVAEDMGRTNYLNACQQQYSNITSCTNHDFSHRTSFGYKFNEQNAAEIGYYSAGQSIKTINGNISDSIDDVEWQFSALKYLILNIGPDTGRLLIFGRLGLVHWEASEAYLSNRVNASGNSVLFGVGAKYYITQDTALRVQYESHRIGNATISWKGNVNMLSTGLTYHF